MGTEDWVLKGTKLITNTKKQKVKIQDRVWNFKITMLKKRRIKIKRRGKKNQSQSYKKKYRYKIDNKYQKAKIKNLEQSLEFQKYNVKAKKKKNKQTKNKIYKKYIYVCF